MRRDGFKPDNEKYGAKLRQLREASGMSLRALAGKLGIQPPHLSKVELGLVSVSEELSNDAARILGEDPVVLFAASGRVTEELRGFISKHPHAFANLVRNLKETSSPEKTIERLVREVRDGEW